MPSSTEAARPARPVPENVFIGYTRAAAPRFHPRFMKCVAIADFGLDDHRQVTLECAPKIPEEAPSAAEAPVPYPRHDRLELTLGREVADRLRVGRSYPVALVFDGGVVLCHESDSEAPDSP